MADSEFGWTSLLESRAPAGCALKAALFTTYDRADERLLAEHLLPAFLKLGREAESDGIERQFFLLELDRRLKQLHDKLFIVSSPNVKPASDDDRDNSTGLKWIWRHVRHLTVGSTGLAVQHAKLWLLHWGPPRDGDPEYLEIVVSSANLSMGAFKGQLQAAWRACLELDPHPRREQLGRWGPLPAFISELAASSGRADRLNAFTALLSRARCPEGVGFLASVPGSHSATALRRTPWGACGLQAAAPPGRGVARVSILTPFLGSWEPTALRRWCSRFGGAPERLHLLWIAKGHPWSPHWVLPKRTLETLVKSKARREKGLTMGHGSKGRSGRHDHFAFCRNCEIRCRRDRAPVSH